MERGLDVVARNTRLQAQLISDLLDISRIVAGKLSLDMDSLDLGSIVSGAVETIESEAKAKGVALETSIEETPTIVVGDSARLQQVVWNLLSNAIKFTPRGGHVRLTLRHAGERAEIVVADDGAGIRPEFLPHVFDRFHQADRSITRRFGGLGLGLSIVKHLVDVHGGSVLAESPGEGQGATFTISLPAIAARGVARPARRGPRQGEAEDTSLLDTIRVLVVEDERDTLDFLTRLLEGQGAIVLPASTAREALSIVRAESPDVVISDIGLPEMDGYDFIQHVRRGDTAVARHSGDCPHRVCAHRRSHARAAGRIPGAHGQAGGARRAHRHRRQLRRADRRRTPRRRRAGRFSPPRVAAWAVARVFRPASSWGPPSGGPPYFEPRLHRRAPSSSHRSPIRASRSGMLRSVNVCGCTSPRSTSSHVHGAETGAPGLARTV